MISQRLIGLSILILLLLLISSCSSQSITGFAVKDKDDKSNETVNETTTEIINDTNPQENQTLDEADKDKKEKPEKDKDKEGKEEIEKIEKEKPKENLPPVWKSEIEEFVIEGRTVIDLSNYFVDANNDSLAYIISTPEKISVDVDGSIVTLTPTEYNFTTSILFTATDGEKATTKGIKLIVPEKKIAVNLQYKSDTSYDADNNGHEPTTGVIDLTVENSFFSWNVDNSKLCTVWNVYSVENEESTYVCYGNSKCCNFVGLLPAKDNWNEIFYSTYGQYGTILDNTISARILYVDFNLSIDEPYAEIYSSEWQELPVRFYVASIDFENVCVDTCALIGFNETEYKLVFELDNAVLNLDFLTYSLAEEVINVGVFLSVKDNEDKKSGSYKLYKNNSLIAEEFVPQDYYNVEVFSDENFFDKLAIENVDITKPINSVIGVDSIKEVSIIGVDIKKKYAINLEDLEFEKAAITATANANTLLKCSQWDFEREICFGSWDFVRNLVTGEKYEIDVKDSVGFVEGDSNVTVPELNITNLTIIVLIKDFQNITMLKNSNSTLNLNGYFSNTDESTNFSYLEHENVSIIFSNKIAEIIPDNEFIGTMFTFITASKNDSFAVSNLFSINVVETINLTLNVSNVTLSLIKEIPNISIIKNTNFTINLSDYFTGIGENADLTYFEQDNLSIVFDDNIAVIESSKDFTGIVFTYIIAKQDFNIAVSNIFTVSVNDVPQLLPTDQLINITDPVMQQKLREDAEINLKPSFRYENIVFTSYQIKNEVVTINAIADDREIKWLTSLRNFNEILR